MNHRLYEDWLLDNLNDSESDDSPEDEMMFNNHIQECKDCQQFAEAIGAIEFDLKHASMIAPAPGFAARWKERLAADRRQVDRRQSVRLLVLNVSLAMIFLMILLVFSWPLISSPNVLLWTYLYQLLRVVSLASLAREFIVSFLQSANTTVPIFVWVLVAGVVSQLIVLWVVSYRSLTSIRRV